MCWRNDDCAPKNGSAGVAIYTCETILEWLEANPGRKERKLNEIYASHDELINELLKSNPRLAQYTRLKPIFDASVNTWIFQDEEFFIIYLFQAYSRHLLRPSTKPLASYTVDPTRFFDAPPVLGGDAEEEDPCARLMYLVLRFMIHLQHKMRLRAQGESPAPNTTIATSLFSPLLDRVDEELCARFLRSYSASAASVWSVVSNKSVSLYYPLCLLDPICVQLESRLTTSVFTLQATAQIWRGTFQESSSNRTSGRVDDLWVPFRRYCTDMSFDCAMRLLYNLDASSSTSPADLKTLESRVHFLNGHAQQRSSSGTTSTVDAAAARFTLNSLDLRDNLKDEQSLRYVSIFQIEQYGYVFEGASKNLRSLIIEHAYGHAARINFSCGLFSDNTGVLVFGAQLHVHNDNDEEESSWTCSTTTEKQEIKPKKDFIIWPCVVGAQEFIFTCKNLKIKCAL